MADYPGLIRFICSGQKDIVGKQDVSPLGCNHLISVNEMFTDDLVPSVLSPRKLFMQIEFVDC